MTSYKRLREAAVFCTFKTDMRAAVLGSHKQMYTKSIDCFIS